MQQHYLKWPKNQTYYWPNQGRLVISVIVCMELTPSTEVVIVLTAQACVLATLRMLVIASNIIFASACVLGIYLRAFMNVGIGKWSCLHSLLWDRGFDLCDISTFKPCDIYSEIAYLLET